MSSYRRETVTTCWTRNPDGTLEPAVPMPLFNGVYGECNGGYWNWYLVIGEEEVYSTNTRFGWWGWIKCHAVALYLKVTCHVKP